MRSGINTSLITRRLKVFAGRCNQETVDLDPLVEQNDLETVQGLLMEHRERTGSTVADAILAEWPDSAGHFIKASSYG